MPRFALLLPLLLTLPATASAHGLGVEAKLLGGVVRLEVFYDDDTPAGGAAITVSVEGGGPVAAGTADERGVWEFPVPPAGRYAVKVDAGDGHATTTVVTVPAAAAGAGVSGGDSREAFTGSQRWWAAAGGLAVIAGGTGLIWAIRRRRGQAAPPA